LQPIINVGAIGRWRFGGVMGDVFNILRSASGMGTRGFKHMGHVGNGAVSFFPFNEEEFFKVEKGRGFL